LTALRFVAAFAVLLSHLDFLGDGSEQRSGWLYETLLRQGYCGVSFFYILSGFILSHAYGDRLKQGSIGLRSYLMQRICRIAPLHWLMALLFIGWLALAGEMPGPGTILLNLGLMHAWAPDPTVHYALNGPSWSLSDELAFYAVFPWLCRMQTRSLGLYLAGGLLLATVAAIIMVRQGGYSATEEWFFYVFPPVRLIDFIVGMLLYRAWRSGHGNALAGTGAEIAVAIAVPAAMIGFSLMALPMPLRWQLAYLPIMATAVLIFAYGRGAVSCALRHPGMILLGQASFALYLTHRPIITLAHRLWGGDPAHYLSMSLSLPPFCVAVSLVIFFFVERPMMGHLRHAAWSHDRKRGGVKAWRPS
jgi:peptidoglycan/LPS O-acetylase OafA/YrhL